MNRIKLLAILVGVSLFCGIMIGWVGPLAFPPIAQVAQPFVCPDGELAQDIIRGEGGGEVTYNSAFQCYSGDSEAGENVTTSAILTAIGIYSLIAFVLLFAFGLRALRSQSARLRGALRTIDAPGVTMDGSSIDMRGAGLDTKLTILATLRTQGLIDDAGYESLIAEARAKG
jgi:hypothetical protein